MDKLKIISERLRKNVEKRFYRFLFKRVDWAQRLTIILGSRGTGKTTLLLQKMNEEKNAIYLSLDNIFFEANRLINTIDELYNEGYRSFFLDEVHRYQYWSGDLKQAYDNYPDIRVIATGSSILQLSKGKSDLSRRAVTYYLPGLSFREFLNFREGLKFESFSLDNVLESHQEISENISDQTDVLKEFREYLKYGYYPYFKEDTGNYLKRLNETINMVVEVDISSFEEISHSTTRNLKKLLYILSQSVPFKPNISRIAEGLNIPRNSVLKMLDLLDRGRILSLLRSDTKRMSFHQKPEKIYLENTNLAWALSANAPDTGNLRETFFQNQLSVDHEVVSSKFGDFLVDDFRTFEIGGPSKTASQIKGVPNSFIAADGIKGGSGKKIPLWLFGFLY